FLGRGPLWPAPAAERPAAANPEWGELERVLIAVLLLRRVEPLVNDPGRLGRVRVLKTEDFPALTLTLHNQLGNFMGHGHGLRVVASDDQPVADGRDDDRCADRLRLRRRVHELAAAHGQHPRRVEVANAESVALHGPALDAALLLPRRF